MKRTEHCVKSMAEICVTLSETEIMAHTEDRSSGSSACRLHPVSQERVNQFFWLLKHLH